MEQRTTAPALPTYKSTPHAEYKLHDTLKQQLQNLGLTKLPAPERIQNKIDSLKKECSKVQNEKKELEERKSTLDVITANIDTLLSYNMLCVNKPHQQYDL